MSPLSPREKQILELFDQGKSYKEIARELRCSVHTIKSHAKFIIAKTKASSLRHAAYLRRGQPAAQTWSRG